MKSLREITHRKSVWASEPGDTFVLSASLERDDAAQWRLYTGLRGGFAIHIDGDQPLQVLAPRDADPQTRGFWGRAVYGARVRGWYHVAYTKSQKQRHLDDLMRWPVRGSRWPRRRPRPSRRSTG